MKHLAHKLIYSKHLVNISHACNLNIESLSASSVQQQNVSQEILCSQAWVPGLPPSQNVAARTIGKVKRFPKDESSKPGHLPVFLGYKAVMAHVVREVHRPGSKVNKDGCCGGCGHCGDTPMVVVGIMDCVETPRGLRTFKTIIAVNTLLMNAKGASKEVA